jgi:transcription elongation factor Elf1
MDQSQRDRRKIRKLTPHHPETLTCAYCGRVKEEVSFCIGASNGPDWCMVEGTGKVTCPGCYDTAQAEAAVVLNRMRVR